MSSLLTMIAWYQAAYFSQLFSNGRELLFSLTDEVKFEQSLILFSGIGYFICAHVICYLFFTCMCVSFKQVFGCDLNHHTFT